ncbi:MAG: branched-chain amino acid ABC transporter permease [Vulcanimicrobiaceae bacterium]
MDGARGSSLAIGTSAALVVCAPFLVPSFVTFELTYAGAYAIAIVGLIVLTGHNGQISLGHGAFVAIGAYAVAIGSTHGIPVGLCVILAIALTGIVGTLVGIVALRLSGVYLALATFAFAVAMPATLKHFGYVTGGSQGIALPRVANDRALYFLTWTLVGITCAITSAILAGRFGRALRALRDHEIAAIAFGIAPARYKALAFGWSAAYAGSAGALLALATAYVSPDGFTLALSLTLLTGAVLGGLGTLWGAIVGGLIVEFLPLYAQTINPAASSIVYGIALIVVMRLMPIGVAGAATTALRRIAAPRLTRTAALPAHHLSGDRRSP